MQNIYLVGFMGTGKTAVGRELAKTLRVQLLDIDDLIVQREKRSINDIFTLNGEPYFRKIERDTLVEVSRKTNHVVSCGGGIMINPDNIATMKQTGKLIALSATPEVIFERTKKHAHRPLLNVSDPKAKIGELLNARKPFYEKSDFIIDTSESTVNEVAQKVLGLIR